MDSSSTLRKRVLRILPALAALSAPVLLVISLAELGLLNEPPSGASFAIISVLFLIPGFFFIAAAYLCSWADLAWSSIALLAGTLLFAIVVFIITPKTPQNAEVGVIFALPFVYVPLGMIALFTVKGILRLFARVIARIL